MPEDRQRTVLVVDDDGGVLRLLWNVLPSFGFRVMLAVDAFEAIDALIAEPGRVDVALVDRHLPGVEGTELTTLLRVVRPDLPYLLTSDEGLNELPEGCAGFVQKPFRPGDLVAQIRAAIDDPPQADSPPVSRRET